MTLPTVTQTTAGVQSTRQHRDGCLYQQLADQLRQHIETGRFPKGKALPSERTLAEQFDVSRVSIRKAIEELVDQQIIIKRRGSGSYVADQLTASLSALNGFTEEAAARGLEVGCRWLSKVTGLPTPDEVMRLAIRPTEPIVRISRVRTANQEPIAIQHSTLIREALPEPDQLDGSLYSAMAASGSRPTQAYQHIAAVAIMGNDAELLSVASGSPGLKTLRIGYRADGKAVEYTESLFRGDRWDCITELTLHTLSKAL